MDKKQGDQSLQRSTYLKALRKSSFSFLAISPLLLGVVGLAGLFQAVVTPKMIATLFGGNVVIDILIGTLTGGSAAGNPVVSYLLGGELLKQGVSLYAVTAFIISWVTIGLIQLPAEVEVFGGRFTLYRNILAFAFTILIATLTAFTVQVLA